MNKSKIVLVVFAVMSMMACKKNWIEEKSNKALVVPTSVKDFQALMDNTIIMNDFQPSMGEVSADNYYLFYNIWETWAPHNRNAYIWARDIYTGMPMDHSNWHASYRKIFYANIVLDGIDKATPQHTPDWNNVKGSALYYRGSGFFHLSQLFAKPYSSTSSVTDLGIPLRLNPGFNEKTVRSTLQETYQQILNDLHSAAAYLPLTPLYKTRPSKPAAYALLSRVYLVMKDYSHALLYADSCLKLYGVLLDYNTLDPSSLFPIPGLNEEVIFQSTIAEEMPVNNYFVDSNLYKSYDDNDLRKKLFFRTNASGNVSFIGTYSGLYGSASSGSRPFGGIATDEVYLTRAECYARAGNIQAAMDDLNSLLIKRWKAGTFTPVTVTNASDALEKILRERRKETLFRGLRWTDLRRLNSEGANITLTRNLNGQVYTLPPNDPRYVLPIPPDIIAMTGIPQNPR